MLHSSEFLVILDKYEPTIVEKKLTTSMFGMTSCIPRNVFLLISAKVVPPDMLLIMSMFESSQYNVNSGDRHFVSVIAI